MGWFGAGAGWALYRRYGWNFIAPLALGGVAYSAGAAMEFARWPTLIVGIVHAHEVFHVAVLAGVILHYAFIWQFADGSIPPQAADRR
jgi:channel protein (hemolysin III family)